MPDGKEMAKPETENVNFSPSRSNDLLTSTIHHTEYFPNLQKSVTRWQRLYRKMPSLHTTQHNDALESTVNTQQVFCVNLYCNCVPPNFAKDTTPDGDEMAEPAKDDAKIGRNDGLAGTGFLHPSVLELCSWTLNEHLSTPKMPWLRKSILAGTFNGQRLSSTKYSDMMPVLNFFWWQSIMMIYSPASQMKGRRARQVFVVKFSMNETQMTMHLER